MAALGGSLFGAISLALGCSLFGEITLDFPGLDISFSFFCESSFCFNRASLELVFTGEVFCEEALLLCENNGSDGAWEEFLFSSLIPFSILTEDLSGELEDLPTKKSI